MIAVFQGIEAFEFRTEGAFLKYVNRIVENRVREAAQHWKAQRRAIDREQPLDADADRWKESPAAQLKDSLAATPSRVVSLQEDLALLEQAMDRLGDESPEQRDLLIAVKLEGQTYREVAMELSISEDAVRMRTRRALDTLTTIYRQLESQGHQST